MASLTVKTAAYNEGTETPFAHRSVIPFHSRLEDETPLNEQELLPVYAVLAHIAYGQDIRQELLQSVVEAEFSVPHITKIPRYRVHEVMEFLIDLRMDGIRSLR